MDQSLLELSPVITEISHQGSLYFLIAKAYPFFPKYAEQFVPGPNRECIVVFRDMSDQI